MIGRGRERVSRGGFQNVRLSVGSLDGLRLETKSADVVYVKYGYGETALFPWLLDIPGSDDYPYVVEKEMAEVRRILRDSGMYVTMGHMKHGTPVGRLLPGFEFQGAVWWSRAPQMEKGEKYRLAICWRKT